MTPGEIFNERSRREAAEAFVRHSPFAVISLSPLYAVP